MHDKLFVYGTLMGDVRSNIAQFLRRNSRFLGHYQVQGQLYDLGFYPGLILSNDEGRRVTGHLYQLLDPYSTLFTLDDYEDIVPGREDAGLYRRELVDVHRKSETESAWIYLYNKPIDNLPLIPFDNYLDFLKTNDAHQQFIQSV
jgi:gamma-glutamylcyclotransferase (GGCT)/AIG2-like uncharacterized protein YtfP